MDRKLSRGHLRNVSLLGGTVQWLHEIKLWGMKEPGLIRDYSNLGLSQSLDSRLLLGHFHCFTISSIRGKAEKTKGDAIQTNPLCYLLAAQLPNTQGEAAAALLGVSILHAILVPPAACKHRVGCMEMICGMKEERRGKFSPTVASSKKRKGNYMLSGSMPHRLVHILLNKLMFGSILSPQN